MATNINNLGSLANLPNVSQSTDTTGVQGGGQISTQTSSAALAAQKGQVTDAMGMPGINQPKGSVLQSAPPIASLNSSYKASDLMSAQQKLSDLGNFAHPSNAALISAMEGGVGMPGQNNMSELGGKGAAGTIAHASSADLDAPATNGTSAGSSVEQQALAARHADNSQKCHGHHAAQNILAERVSAQTGISKSSAEGLIHALAPETKSGFVFKGPGSQVVDQAFATLAQLRGGGTGNSDTAMTLQKALSEVGSGAKTFDKASGGRPTSLGAFARAQHSIDGGMQQLHQIEGSPASAATSTQGQLTSQPSTSQAPAIAQDASAQLAQAVGTQTSKTKPV